MFNFSLPLFILLISTFLLLLLAVVFLVASFFQRNCCERHDFLACAAGFAFAFLLCGFVFCSAYGVCPECDYKTHTTYCEKCGTCIKPTVICPGCSKDFGSDCPSYCPDCGTRVVDPPVDAAASCRQSRPHTPQ